MSGSYLLADIAVSRAHGPGTQLSSVHEEKQESAIARTPGGGILDSEKPDLSRRVTCHKLQIGRVQGVPQRTGAIVTRTKEAGALILGKGPWANLLPGTWDPLRRGAEPL
jgi:hypothetical protein